MVRVRVRVSVKVIRVRVSVRVGTNSAAWCRANCASICF